jgi:phage baseplate assembly protein W
LTQIGERLFVPQFGARTSLLLFEPNDLILKRLAQQFIEEALVAWEPRISISNYNMTQDNKNVFVSFSFSIVRLGLDSDGMFTGALVVSRLSQTP